MGANGGMSKNEIQLDFDEKDLFDTLKRIPKKNLPGKELLKMIEGSCDTSPLFSGSSVGFYESYIIVLFKTYCKSSDDLELILAASGLLQICDRNAFPKQGDRRKIYWRYACEYNALLQSTWSEKSVDKSIRDIEDRIFRELAEDIIASIRKQENGRLNLKDGIPTDLQLPAPRCPVIYSKTAENPTEGEPLPIAENVAVDAPEEGGYDLPFSSPDDTLIVPAKPASSGEPGDRVDAAEKSKLLDILAATILLVVVAALLEAAVIYQLCTEKTTSDSETVSVEDLWIFNDEIILEPGERKELTVRVSPDEADKDSLQRVSTNPGLVWVEGWDVIAQSGWQEETDHTATIIVQLGNVVHKEAHVTVQKPSTALPGSDIAESIGYGKVQD